MTFQETSQDNFNEIGVFSRPIKKSTEAILRDPDAFTWKEVLPRIQEEHEIGKTVVIANGNFVLFHLGHCLLLEDGRKAGTQSRQDKDPNAVIVVGIVNADHQTFAKDPIKAKLESARERAM